MSYELGTEAWQNSGVTVGYSYRGGRISARGWYDGFVSIAPVGWTLGEFLKGLHITLDDCERALEGEVGGE